MPFVTFYEGFDCYNGSVNSSSPAMFASGVKIMFQELNGTKGFQGKISWKPLQSMCKP